MSTALDTAPDGARAYDYLLGGEEAFEADENLVARIEAMWPPGTPGPRDLAARNRAYQWRAVSSAVHDRITQVLVPGCGYPAPQPLHEAARRASSSARVAYADCDPTVVTRVRAAVAGVPGVTCAEGDLRRPGDVMDCPEVRAVIDEGQPTCLVLGMVLHTMNDAAARRVIAGWAERLAPGSRLVVTVLTWADETLRVRAEAAYGEPLHDHGPALAGMLGGLDPLGNGLEVARGWGPECLDPPGPAHVLAAVARKP